MHRKTAKHSSTAEACERVVHALVTCRLDLNNALLVGLPQRLVARIQHCQNIATCTVTCWKKTCRITAILKVLHWLPVEFRIQYKVLLHVYCTLNGLSPGYLAGMLERHVPTCLLRSTDSILLTVPWTRHRWGDRAFSRAGPVLWNDLPLAMHSASSLASFKMQLKTLLFTRAYDWLLSVSYCSLLCISFISSLFFYLSDIFSALSSNCWILHSVRINYYYSLSMQNVNNSFVSSLITLIRQLDRLCQSPVPSKAWKSSECHPVADKSEVAGWL